MTKSAQNSDQNSAPASGHSTGQNTDDSGITLAMVAAQYPPDHGPGATRMIAFARGLAARGIVPRVFASRLGERARVASWFEVAQPLDPARGGSGQKRQKHQGFLDKVINLFVPMEPNWTLSLAGLDRLFEEAAQKAGGAERAFQAIYTTSNPLAGSVAGMRLKRRHGLPLIVEFRDPWTTNPNRIWPTRLHYEVERFLERRVLRAADAIIMNTPTARRWLLRQYPWLEADRVHAISHGYDGAPTLEQHTAAGHDKDEIVIGYAGTFYSTVSRVAAPVGLAGRLRRIASRLKDMVRYRRPEANAEMAQSTPRTLLAAVARYNEARSGNAPRLRLEFMGTDPNYMRPLLAEYGLEEVTRLHDWVPADEVRERLAVCDLLFLTNPAITGSPFIGTKTMDFIAAGRPILAELPEGDQAALIRHAGAGWICPPRDVTAMYERLVTLTQPTEDAASVALRQWQPDPEAVARLARDNQVADLHEILLGVLGAGPRRAVLSQGFAPDHALDHRDTAQEQGG